MKKLKRILLYILGCLSGLLLFVFLFLWFNSRGSTKAIVDKDGNRLPSSVAVIEQVDICGLQQSMIIRGTDTAKPVLLYLHGGPGSPEYLFVPFTNLRLEDDFVVCYWEQRGSCMSYSENIPDSSMNLSQFVEDAAEVSRYLIKRFHKDRIYLLGHSWGSYLGSFTVKKFPELYYAYFSVGQVADQQKAEKISYDFVLSEAKNRGEKDAIKELEEIGPPPYITPADARNKMMRERKYVTRYGGAVHEGNFYALAAKSFVMCKEYTLKQKSDYFKGMFYSMEKLWPDVFRNLTIEIPEQKIPVYIFQGKYDYQTATSVAKEYYDSLRAPVKDFFLFEKSAHSPMFEEPDKFRAILAEIVRKTEDR